MGHPVHRILKEENSRRSGDNRVWFHSDGVQAPGHVPLNLGPISLPPHPRGRPGSVGISRRVGLLDAVVTQVSRSGGRRGPGHGAQCLITGLPCPPICCTPDVLKKPLMYGGQQQGGLRPGTEAVGAIVAMSRALEAINNPGDLEKRMDTLRRLSNAIWDTLLPFIVTGAVLPTGCMDPTERACHHVSFCVRDKPRQEILQILERDAGVVVSGGSACSTESAMPSHVLDAMRIPSAYIHGSIRITLSHTNTLQEITDVVCPALRRVLEKV